MHGLLDNIELVPINLQERPIWYKERVYPENKATPGVSVEPKKEEITEASKNGGGGFGFWVYGFAWERPRPWLTNNRISSSSYIALALYTPLFGRGIPADTVLALYTTTSLFLCLFFVCSEASDTTWWPAEQEPMMRCRL
ncbi:hypothetical protein ACET3Z_002020 [Daucus carota]